ncbi:hypothetical protein [Ruegeria arenilitoris]|uniref:hypothetical protein n=1 Tax=Ruegeria arenilitoris TaxID=1173585 RepID=UPI001479D612|nr:hypothetical protein [Ruegeria arenilitoris]
MLEILGTIGGNILSLPGILGLAVGMMTRQLWLAATMGAVIGILETLAFAHWAFAKVEPMELIIGVLVGVCASSIGCLIRQKGATV